MPDQYPKSTAGPPAPFPDPERRQRNRMLLAVFLLLFAVAIVLLRDWGALFSSDDGVAAQPPAQAAATPSPVAPDSPSASQPESIPPVAPQLRPRRRRASAATAAKPMSAVAPESGIVVTNRAVLPPLRVEVVAGNRKTPVRPASNSMHLDIDSPPQEDTPAPGPEIAAAGAAPTAIASERMRISNANELELEHATQPDYPMLARQMKVQGSVTLEALIGKDGGIQQLQVLQGPTILADAARQAVRQWRFKPYLQDGQAVETQAHITVNFTISTN